MIFGVDDRGKVAVSGDYFARKIVHISVRYPDGSMAVGSGVMVGRNDVLTAAHLLYSEEHGGYAVFVEATAARDGEIKPYGVSYGVESVVSDEWINGEDYGEDWGLITLNSAIGDYTGYVNIATYSDSLSFENVFSMGYPGDLKDGNSLYYTDGSIDSIQDNELLFFDDMDAYAGQSGSGIFDYNGDELGVIGIISYESYAGIDRNVALGIDETLQQKLRQLTYENDENLQALFGDNIPNRDLIETFDLMYNSFFGRSGSKEELESVLSIYNQGVGVPDIARGYYNYAIRNGYDFTTLDNRAFITYVFEKILKIEYTDEYIEHWTKIQDNSSDIAMTRGDILYRCAIDESFVKSHSLAIYDNWHDMYGDWGLHAIGSADNDIIYSDASDSMLAGFEGHDVLGGKNGADYLWGGSGDDVLIGGEGGDFFAFGDGDGIDIVMDFDVGEDKIRVRGETEYGFAVDSRGDMLILDKSGQNGLKLIGISYWETSSIVVIVGELV